MKKFLAALKIAWIYLDGKKTIIAATYWTLVEPIVLAIYPNGAPHNLSLAMTIAGVILTTFGLGHKAVKWYATSDDAQTPPAAGPTA